MATILSAQTTDARVNQITPRLFASFPSPASYTAGRQLELAEIIKPLGLAKSKSRYLIATAEIISKQFAGQVPNSLQDLLKLPGVGRKVASVVLGNWFSNNEAFTVDTHVARVSRRLGLSNGSNPLEIELDLQQLFVREEWAAMSLRLVLFGRDVCRAKRPRCLSCPLRPVCPAAVKFIKNNNAYT